MIRFLILMQISIILPSLMSSVEASETDLTLPGLSLANQQKSISTPVPEEGCRFSYHFDDPSMPYSVSLLFGEHMMPLFCNQYLGVVEVLENEQTILKDESDPENVEYVRGYICTNGWEIMVNSKWSHAYVNAPNCKPESFLNQPELYR